ncbi:MAG TPA: FTR1 family protein, partial [Candidatus Dormibacteraeota bacterium]|nr:FTR1 family protein [Candidatus Dormibacteraeota bacterium]
LIVGIVAGYLVRIGRRDALSKVALGVGAAIALSVAIGLVVALTIQELPEVIQATAEATASLVAVSVLTWMTFWMRRQSRALKGDLERGVDLAITSGGTFALVMLAFAAVVRDGVETVLFLVPIVSFEGSGITTFIGGVVGLAVAIGVGWAIFVAGRRVNLRRFFNVTGTVLIFVAAGLVAFAISELGNAGLISNGGVAFDLSGILSDTSALGSVLHGLFGYRAAPTPLELVGYLAYLVPVLGLFVLDRPLVRRPAAAA